MTVSRRAFVTTTASAVACAAATAAAAATVVSSASAAATRASSAPTTPEADAQSGVPAATASAGRVVRPKRLRPGDVVGLIDPASATWEPVDVDIVEESLAALGL
jgi:hypothetical protein